VTVPRGLSQEVADPMRKTEPRPIRHHFRIWLKMAIQSGLIDRLPPLYEADGFQTPLRTDEYARQLVAELRDPDASRRALTEIIASARQFKSWVEARRKESRHRALIECRPEERIIDLPPGRPRTFSPDKRRPRQEQRTNQPDSSPRLHPMWDDWIDSLER
jgi:hypothetical protein